MWRARIIIWCSLSFGNNTQQRLLRATWCRRGTFDAAIKLHSSYLLFVAPMDIKVTWRVQMGVNSWPLKLHERSQSPRWNFSLKEEEEKHHGKKKDRSLKITEGWFTCPTNSQLRLPRPTSPFLLKQHSFLILHFEWVNDCLDI